MVLAVATSLAAIGCRQNGEVEAAFYFWKTRYALSGSDSGTLRSTNARKMYIRLCDVDWSGAEGKILPRAPLDFAQMPDTALHFVPVVFITPRTLVHLPDSMAVQSLAQNIAHLIARMCDAANIKPREVQLDCDWTEGRRETYFALLRAMGRQPFLEGKILSATIRLHQVKYVGKSGVPPTNRGMLMCYNMGNTRKAGAHNSILDADEAEDYLANVNKYPLALDVALPLFRWCVLFRNEKLVGILRDVQPEEAVRCAFLQQEKGPLYRCMADTLWYGYALKSGDVVRVESPSVEDIHRVARATARQIRNADLTVALYHLDSLTCSKYSADELESFFDVYR